MRPARFLFLCLPLLATPLLAHADQSLATAKNCMGCHAPEKKLIGPSYKDIAAKYKDQKDAEAMLVGKVMKGSNGVWGTMAMPPATNLSEAEAKKLVAWVLAR
ncbi:c-type cytochrome [Azovibrio restrictus]|uniref:c-type cytochrome n=1 Tax=Azovibrio restrictus TaxID=146938 RepID=UPI0026E989AE|nr:c-type cytochrome [Azovibrio restrictus]MDD3482590.1 c-type cytochrome [Azovibrio restrictus]